MKVNSRILTRGLGKKKERIFEIDFLRCFPIIVVMLYHFCYDFAIIPSVTSNYQEVASNYPALDSFIRFTITIFYNDIIMEVIAPLVGGLFIFVAGISCALSRNNIRRGLLMALAAIGISLGTWALDAIFAAAGVSFDVFIGWGVIHLMAFSILFYAFFDWLVKKLTKHSIPALVLLFLGVLILLAGIFLRLGITIDGKTITWPVAYIYGGPLAELEVSPWAFLLSAIGYYGNTVDFWPILPYTGVLFIGIAFGKILYKEKKSIVPKLYNPVLKPFCFIGRHTIWFYLLHQPIYIVVISLVMLCLGFRL